MMTKAPNGAKHMANTNIFRSSIFAKVLVVCGKKTTYAEYVFEKLDNMTYMQNCEITLVDSTMNPIGTNAFAALLKIFYSFATLSRTSGKARHLFQLMSPFSIYYFKETH